MVISQGDIFWADLAEPIGSSPGFRRPVVVVQSDEFNRSQLATIVCVPLTSNVKWASAPGNVFIAKKQSKLSRDSVANVSQIVTVDRAQLTERIGTLPKRHLSSVLDGIGIVLGRHGAWRRRPASRANVSRSMIFLRCSGRSPVEFACGG